MVADLEPDVLIMDIAMPDLNGIEATRQIKAEFPQVKVIALSMHADRRFVEGMLSAGASGYVLKSSASEELVSAIDALYEIPSEMPEAARTALGAHLGPQAVRDVITLKPSLLTEISKG